METNKFDKFLDENLDLKEAATKYADGLLGKDANYKEKENVMVIFVMGAVWQAHEFVRKLSKG